MRDYTNFNKRSSKSLIRKKTHHAKQSSLKLAISWILMIIVALFFVQQRLSYIRTEKDVRRLLKEKEEIELSILPLQLEHRYLTQQERIERIAQSELNLQIPRKVQIINLDEKSSQISTSEQVTD